MAHAYTKRLKLEDGKDTTIHVVRYDRLKFSPRVVVFDRPSRLIDWCEKNQVSEAVVGSFFLRNPPTPLGDLWIDGKQIASVPFSTPWDKTRGALYVDKNNDFQIKYRNELPNVPRGDLLQAGPLLVAKGRMLGMEAGDVEGFSRASDQFDSDITAGRYPRSAIGLNDDYIWSVVCDGYGDGNAGLSLSELANFMIDQGAESALNLDGGGSSSLISNQLLINKPRTKKHGYNRGRKISTAIIFETIDK